MTKENQENKRLFFGLDLPKENKTLIFRWLESSVQSNRKPTLEHNLHLTLAFLSEVNPNTEAKLINFAKTLVTPSFSLEFKSCDYWQNTGILFLKPNKQLAALTKLANKLRNYGEANAIYQNPYAFHPHITLMRGCKTQPKVIQPLPPLTIHFDEFKLFHSTRVNNQLTYVPVQRFALMQ